MDYLGLTEGLATVLSVLDEANRTILAVGAKNTTAADSRLHVELFDVRSDPEDLSGWLVASISLPVPLGSEGLDGTVRGISLRRVPRQVSLGGGNAGDDLLEVSNMYGTWVVDVTEALDQEQDADETEAVDSFGSSEAPCGPGLIIGPGQVFYGPPQHGMTDARHWPLEWLGGGPDEIAGRFVVTGYRGLSNTIPSALSLLALRYHEPRSRHAAGEDRLRRVGVLSPELGYVRMFEVNRPFHHDPSAGTLVGASRANFGLVVAELPDDSARLPAIDAVEGPPPSFYPPDSLAAWCRGVRRAFTSSYLPLNQLQTEEDCLSGCTEGQLPLNANTHLNLEGYMGPDAPFDLPTLRWGFGYEFQQGIALGDEDEVLLLTDRAGAALWACESDPLHARALDAWGRVTNALGVAWAGRAGGSDYVAVTGSQSPALHLLRWDAPSRRLAHVVSISPSYGLPSQGVKPTLGEVVSISDPDVRRLSSSTPTHVAAVVGGQEGGLCGELKLRYDIMLLRTWDQLEALSVSYEGLEHRDPGFDPSGEERLPSTGVAGGEFARSAQWWYQGQEGRWMLRPWYRPSDHGAAMPVVHDLQPMTFFAFQRDSTSTYLDPSHPPAQGVGLPAEPP